MYVLVSVAIDYINGPGDQLFDIAVGYFTIVGKSGLFSTWVPFPHFWVQNLAYTIYYFYADIIEVYGETPLPPPVSPLVAPGIGGDIQPV